MTLIQIFNLGRIIGRLEKEQPWLFAADAIPAILDTAAKAYGVTVQDMTGEKHYHRLSVPRWAVAYALRKQGVKLQDVANILGRRHHTTVIHMVRQAEDLIDRHDARFIGLIQQLKNIRSATPEVVEPEPKPEPVTKKPKPEPATKKEPKPKPVATQKKKEPTRAIPKPVKFTGSTMTACIRDGRWDEAYATLNERARAAGWPDTWTISHDKGIMTAKLP